MGRFTHDTGPQRGRRAFRQEEEARFVPWKPEVCEHDGCTARWPSYSHDGVPGPWRCLDHHRVTGPKAPEDPFAGDTPRGKPAQPGLL